MNSKIEEPVPIRSSWEEGEVTLSSTPPLSEIAEIDYPQKLIKNEDKMTTMENESKTVNKSFEIHLDESQPMEMNEVQISPQNDVRPIIPTDPKPDESHNHESPLKTECPLSSFAWKICYARKALNFPLCHKCMRRLYKDSQKVRFLKSGFARVSFLICTDCVQHLLISTDQYLNLSSNKFLHHTNTQESIET